MAELGKVVDAAIQPDEDLASPRQGIKSALRPEHRTATARSAGEGYMAYAPSIPLLPRTIQL